MNLFQFLLSVVECLSYKLYSYRAVYTSMRCLAEVLSSTLDNPFVLSKLWSILHSGGGGVGGKGWISPQLINPRRASAAGLRYSVCVFVCVTALKSKVRNHRILHGIF